MLWKKDWMNVSFFLYCTLSNSTTTFPRKNINSFAVLPQGWFANMPCTCVSSVHFLNQEAEIDTPVLQSTWCFRSYTGWNSSNDMLHLRKDRFTTLSAVPALSKWKIDYVMREDWCFMIITQRACFTFQEYLTSSNNL